MHAALESRTERPHRAGPSFRVEIEGERIRAWSREIGIADLPTRVARAARAILPDGATWWVGRGERDGSVEFTVEKRYASTDPDDGVRGVRLAEDGTVLERSYPITREDLPPALATHFVDFENIPMTGELKLPAHFSVVQGEGPDRYRVRGPISDLLREFDAEGRELRRGRVQTVRATTW